METGRVQLDAGVNAPCIVIKDLDGSNVMLFVILETGPIQYVATRGDSLSIGVFVSDG